MIPTHVRRSFGLQGPAVRLPGGCQPVYRVGEVVVKRLHNTSLETENSLALAPWLARELAQVHAQGFRLAKPLPSQDGLWMLEDGWSAWRFIPGELMRAEDVPVVIEAIRALHRAVRHVPQHPLLEQNTIAWGVAHRHCWEQRPQTVHPLLADLVDALYAQYTPMPPLAHQLIHGDLNPDNVLVTPRQPPGFIDFTPFWAPVDFAIGIFANWVGPRQGDLSVLRHFDEIPHFRQLLLRAAVRMLLIVSELEGVEGWEHAPEKRAAELVLDWLE